MPLQPPRPPQFAPRVSPPPPPLNRPASAQPLPQCHADHRALSCAIRSRGRRLRCGAASLSASLACFSVQGQANIRTADSHRRNGPPGHPPPPPDQSDRRRKKRGLPSGASGRAILGTHTFGSQTGLLLKGKQPPPPGGVGGAGGGGGGAEATKKFVYLKSASNFRPR